MLFELSILSLFFIYSYINTAYKHEFKSLIFLFFIPILILVTLRQFGYDLNNYYTIYNEIVGLDFSISSFEHRVGVLNKHYEATFHIFSHMSDYFGFGFRGVLFLYILVSIVALVFAGFLTGLPLTLFFSAYFLIAFLPGPYESIRSSVAILVSFSAIMFFSKRSYVAALVLFIVSFYFHKTVLIFPVLYFLYSVGRFFRITNKLILIVTLGAFPLSILLLTLVVEKAGFSQPILVSIHAILTREGKESFANSTEMLKYLLMIGRCLMVYLLVFFINANTSLLAQKEKRKSFRLPLNLTNIMVFLSLSMIISNQFVIAARIVELSYLLVIYLLVFTIHYVKGRKYNILFHFATIGMLGINLVAIFLMYLLPSGVPV